MPSISKPYCFFISTSWNKGAVSQQFRALANMLAARGHRVVILVGANKKQVECQEGNPVVYAWPSIRPTKFRDAYFLMKMIQKFRPDCLIANFASVNIMVLVGWFMRVAKRISWYHTMSGAIKIDQQLPEWKSRFYEVRKRLIYRLTTNIVPVSEAALEDVSSGCGIDRSKCQVQYNSLSDPLMVINEAGEVNQIKNRLTCVGRLYPVKGQDVLIQAMAILKPKFPDLMVEFAGDGPSKDHYTRLASDLDVAENCVFWGELPYGEVLKKMASSYATVCPSKDDACPLVNIESMAVGTPVIASAVGGIPELIRDGVDGFLVPPENPVRLAEKIELLLSNPQLRQVMGRNARQNYLARFEQEKVLLQLSQWLEGIVVRNNP
jgi:glycosyltransferase involved in cell wall biosynthesis